MASLPQPVKLYYNITAYRYENVQKGRYRQFNQFGVEVFESPEASVDVEIISMINLLFEGSASKYTIEHQQHRLPGAENNKNLKFWKSGQTIYVMTVSAACTGIR